MQLDLSSPNLTPEMCRAIQQMLDANLQASTALAAALNTPTAKKKRGRKPTEDDGEEQLGTRSMCDNCGSLHPQNKVKPWIRNRAHKVLFLCPDCVTFAKTNALKLEQLPTDYNLELMSNPTCPWLGTRDELLKEKSPKLKSKEKEAENGA